MSCASTDSSGGRLLLESDAKSKHDPSSLEHHGLFLPQHYPREGSPNIVTIVRKRFVIPFLACDRLKSHASYAVASHFTHTDWWGSSDDALHLMPRGLDKSRFPSKLSWVGDSNCNAHSVVIDGADNPRFEHRSRTHASMQLAIDSNLLGIFWISWGRGDWKFTRYPTMGRI